MNPITEVKAVIAAGFDVGVTVDTLISSAYYETQFKEAFLPHTLSGTTKGTGEVIPKQKNLADALSPHRSVQFCDAFITEPKFLPSGIQTDLPISQRVTSGTLPSPESRESSKPFAIQPMEVPVRQVISVPANSRESSKPFEVRLKDEPDKPVESSFVQPETPLVVSQKSNILNFQNFSPIIQADKVETHPTNSNRFKIKPSIERAITVDKYGQIQFQQEREAISVYATVPPTPPTDLTLLDMAEQRLAKLPLTTIPKVSPLPQNSRMPLKANPFFVGHDEQFRAIAKALKAGETVVISQVETSLMHNKTQVTSEFGGIGKTQLASEFVYRYGQYFNGGIFWLNFAEPASIPVEIVASGASLTAQLRADFRNLLLEEQMRLVLSVWRSPLPRLLIFDNCEDEALLTHWRPPTGGTRVIVTSRQPHWKKSTNIHVIKLDVLPRKQSIALLRQYRPDPLVSEADLQAIAAEIGDLPLALHLAGSFLVHDRQESTVADYLGQLHRFDLSKQYLLKHRSTLSLPTDHDYHTFRTFMLNYEQLDSTNPIDMLAQVILFRAAYFASSAPIPRDLLLATIHYGSSSKQGQHFWGKLRGFLNTGDLSDPATNLLRQAKEAILRLIELGLLEAITDGALWLHPLLSSFVRQIAPSLETQAAVKKTLLEISQLLKQAGSPVTLLTWQPHIYAMSESLQQHEEEQQLASKPTDVFSYHLATSNDYSWERLYYERALSISEQMLGENHPYTAQSLDNLGTLLSFQGDYFAGRFCFERALAIRLAALGENDSETAKSFNNLGALLDAQGDYPGAKRYYEQSLAIREHILGEQHADTAQSLNNLGELLYKQEQYPMALSYFERALAISENVLGKYHPDTARILNNLGALLEAQEEPLLAYSAYEQALLIFKMVLGKDHPDTATGLNNLGTILITMGNYQDANVYYEEALSIRMAVFGDKHPDTADSLYNLAVLNFYKHNYEEATDLMNQAFKIQEMALGPHHPHTQASQEGLAVIKIRLPTLQKLTNQLLQTLPRTSASRKSLAA